LVAILDAPAYQAVNPESASMARNCD
jgi:hypothetical protein